jgi:hypothetical protein
MRRDPWTESADRGRDPQGLTRPAHVKANPSDAAATVAGCYRTEAKNALDNIRPFTYHEVQKVGGRVDNIISSSTGAHIRPIITRPDPAEWMNTKLWPE